MNGSVEPTGVGGELQVSEGGLLGEAVEQLAGFAVLVAGRQLQRGQFLHRVLVQDQAFVDHHRWRQAVLWGGGTHTHKNIRCTQKKHTHTQDILCNLSFTCTWFGFVSDCSKSLGGLGVTQTWLLQMTVK